MSFTCLSDQMREVTSVIEFLILEARSLELDAQWHRKINFIFSLTYPIRTKSVVSKKKDLYKE